MSEMSTEIEFARCDECAVRDEEIRKLGLALKAVTANMRTNGLHPLVWGLADRLPKEPCEWDPDERAAWLRAFDSVMDLLYGAPAPQRRNDDG